MSDDDRSEVVRMSDKSTFCYAWTAKKLCFCCESEERSRNFSITVDGNECTCYIQGESYYPNKSSGFIRFTLSRSDISSVNKACLTLKCSIMNRQGILNNTKIFASQTFPFHSDFLHSSFGRPCEHISNDSYNLTLVIEVTSESIRNNLQKTALDARLPNDLELTFNNQKFSDLTLVVEEQEIRVHKVILASRSPVFAAMLESNMAEKNKNKVDITDIDYETMKHVLLYIYTGKFENLELASMLLGPADKYALDGLKNICTEVLSEAITVENVVETLKLADLYRASKLKEKAIDFMAKRFKDVTATEGFKSLLKSDSHLFEKS